MFSRKFEVETCNYKTTMGYLWVLQDIENFEKLAMYRVANFLLSYIIECLNIQSS